MLKMRFHVRMALGGEYRPAEIWRKAGKESSHAQRGEQRA